MTDVNFDEIFKYILLFRKDLEVVGLNERLRWILSNGRLSSIFCLQVPEVFRRSIFQTALWRDVYQAGWNWDQLHYNSGCDWSQWSHWWYSLPLKNVIKTSLSSYWWGECSCWSCGPGGSGSFLSFIWFLPQLYLNGGFKGGETTFKLHFRDSGKDVRQRQ